MRKIDYQPPKSAQDSRRSHHGVTARSLAATRLDL